MMELKAIRLFVILAEELHFGRAAKRAGVTQSVLSVQIKRLEDVLEAKLFTRSTREVQLTDVGMAFWDEALGVLRRVDQAVHAAKAMAAGSGRLIRIGITSAVEVSSLMDRIAGFRATRPDIQVLIRELGTVEQEAALGNGDIDVGILHPPLDRSGLITTSLSIDRFFAVLHPAFFDLKPRAAWSALFNQPIIFYPRRRAPRLYDQFVGFAETKGFSANIVAEAESFLAAVVMARAGLGIALLPRQVTHLHKGLKVFPLRKDCPLSLETACAIREAEASDVAIRACVTALRSEA